MFFKKLHLLLNDLSSHFKKIGNDNRTYIYNFAGVLSDSDAYFCVTRGFIRIEYKKISNNIYFVEIPIQNSKLYLPTYIRTLK